MHFYLLATVLSIILSIVIHWLFLFQNCQLMMDSMNFDDIERFAASNFTEF